MPHDLVFEAFLEISLPLILGTTSDCIVTTPPPTRKHFAFGDELRVFENKALRRILGPKT
jgi:hypothetical protein